MSVALFLGTKGTFDYSMQHHWLCVDLKLD